MNNILFGYLNDFYIIYLDNIFIYSDNSLEYEIYIRLVLQILHNIGLKPISRNTNLVLLEQNI
jgi:hypothetical protein